jgi:hypothetical protein
MPKNTPPKSRRRKDSLERKAEEGVARMEALLTRTRAEVARSKDIVKKLDERKSSKE